ncbi:helix-turn-helix domain-containing protein [Brevibacillus choshinensis]|uniref:helix-turn-helix domain-containing protein n=1 Tax=Brevibacillus choshinensis TaxID=54911 RepID=UPI002E21795C|nr:helix-turn-helix domain-containing protein [Brevibacillus choshinensis]MED4581309.1 helix-turn-helix domain-containing protein [Brevibacillus choshinensis]
MTCLSSQKKLNQRLQVSPWEKEADLTRKVLADTKGNRGEAAKILGMDRTTLWRRRVNVLLHVQRLLLLRLQHRWFIPQQAHSGS